MTWIFHILRTQKFIVKLFLFIATSLSLFALTIYIVYVISPHHILTDTSIFWSNEWQQISENGIIKEQTKFSGSEFSFDIQGVQELSIKADTTNTDADTTVVGYLDNNSFLLSVKELASGAAIFMPTDSKRHAFRLIFYCRGYNPCNLTITDILTKSGTVFPPRKKPLKILGVVGDSISLLYANDNYSSILSRDISYHLHNASIWGRSLARTGKINPAVQAVKDSLFPYKPDVVIIMLGTNDILGDINEEDFFNDYKNLIAQIRTSSPKSQIITVSIFPGRDQQLEQIAGQWNTKIQSYMPSNSYYVDAFSLLDVTDYQDAIHPNAQGQIKIAHFLENYLVVHHLL